MGDFSHHCSLSGLTMGPTVPVVAWKVQKSKFKDDTEYPWIPLDFPVVGFAGDYGNIVDEKYSNNDLIDDGPMVMCHLAFFKHARKLWHDEDGTESIYDSVITAHEKYKKSIEEYNKLVQSNPENKYWQRHANDLYGQASRAIFNKRCFLKWFDKLYLGETSGDEGMSMEELLASPKCVGPFEKRLLDLIIGGPEYPNLRQVCDNLEKMLCCYMLVPRVSGKQILPVGGTYPPQWTDYKQEAKWFNLVNKKVNALKKNKSK